MRYIYTTCMFTKSKYDKAYHHSMLIEITRIEREETQA